MPLLLLTIANLVLAILLVLSLAGRPDIPPARRRVLITFALLAPLLIVALYHRRIWPGSGRN